MKFLFIYALLLFAVGRSIGQDNQHLFKRSINIKNLGKDSVNISYNDTYRLTEDSCAQITRYSHYNFEKCIFFGKFKDVSNADHNLVVAEGNYNENGFKDGEFITHYLNGNLQAKGSFKNNKYIGKWEFYYENGKPELIFEVVGNEYHILNAWNTEYKQIVTSGKGRYSVNYMLSFLWSGKISNGMPDETWELKIKPDDDPIMTEKFDKNKFAGGENKVMPYTDSSHIVLVKANKLLLCNAEQMFPAAYGCNTPKIVGAKYPGGLDAYSDEIKTVVLDYLNRIYISNNYHHDFAITGEIDEKGALINLHSNSTQGLDRKVILQLYKLSLLQPATINGKPVKQGFTITFSFENSYYNFRYNFLPLQTN